jgi:CubicO group peptidase (beta-lactamase class C family)
VDTTLERALPHVNWGAVTEASYKKTITVGQMLSMSSGLQSPCASYGDQSTVEWVLSSPSFSSDQVENFNYLCSGSILSYIIFQQTGKTPLAYAQEELLPALGITRNVAWTPTHGDDDIQESGHGLVLAPVELAKLGQLYRQGGMTGGAASKQLIPTDFAAASSTNQLSGRIPSHALVYLGSACTFKSNGAGYGWMKWLFETAHGQVDCAVGHQGQFICTWPDLDVVVAITSTQGSDYTSSCQLLDLVASGLDFGSSDDTWNASTPTPPPAYGTCFNTVVETCCTKFSVCRRHCQLISRHCVHVSSRR